MMLITMLYAQLPYAAQELYDSSCGLHEGHWRMARWIVGS